MFEKSKDESVSSVWLEPINELSGRLHIEFEDLKPGLRHAVYLELKNYSLIPTAVINQPQIHVELLNLAGEPVSTESLLISGPKLDPQWAVIPQDAYIGFRIDMRTIGAPTRGQGVALIAVGGKNWRVKVGKYVLKSSLEFIKKDDGPSNQWVGELELAPVEVVVTSEMLEIRNANGVRLD